MIFKKVLYAVAVISFSTFISFFTFYFFVYWDFRSFFESVVVVLFFSLVVFELRRSADK